jgi:tetratricopeptide (TPR) repeat protein
LGLLAGVASAEPYLEQPIVAELRAQFRARLAGESCREYFRLYSTDVRNWRREGDKAEAEVAFFVEYISDEALHGTALATVECLGRRVGDGLFQKGQTYRSAVFVYALSRWAAGWHIDRIATAAGDREAGGPAGPDDRHPPTVGPGESPQRALDFYNRGLQHFVERDYGKALEDYDAAIAIDPRLGVAYNNRCLTLAVARREAGRALADCDQARRLLPGRVDVPETRGIVLLLLGEPMQAEKAFDDALKMSPGKPVALYGRGIARTRLGDTVGGTADKVAAEARHPGVQRTLEAYGIR